MVVCWGDAKDTGSVPVRAAVRGRVDQSAAKLLTEITRNFGIAAAIPTENQTLDQVELLCLPDRRILMVVVTRDRIVRNKGDQRRCATRSSAVYGTRAAILDGMADCRWLSHSRAVSGERMSEKR